MALGQKPIARAFSKDSLLARLQEGRDGRVRGDHVSDARRMGRPDSAPGKRGWSLPRGPSHFQFLKRMGSRPGEEGTSQKCKMAAGTQNQ